MSAQLFYPSLQEMDNFYDYISQLNIITGICKIIPPTNWISNSNINLEKIELDKIVCQEVYKVNPKKERNISI